LSDFGWYGSIIEVSKTGVLGNLKQTERANMWDFLNVLSYNKADDEASALMNK